MTKNILLTGGNSMIARAIQREVPCYEIIHNDTEMDAIVDLTKRHEFTKFCRIYKPERMIHLAAFSGNLNFNQTYPSKTFEDNIRIGLNVFSEWFQYGKAKKALNVIPSCAYPDYPICMEHMLWNGKCHTTIESHGLARRCIEAYTRQLNKEGARIITCIVNNSGGEFDSFDPVKTKVIGGFINKFIKAKEEGATHVVCWGQGKETREFIFCDDVSKCLLQALDTYEDLYEPLNITSGEEITIKELAETIAELVGFTGDIYWDKTKPDGQMRKKLSTTKMRKYISIEFTPIRSWLKTTIDWYLSTRKLEI